MQNYMRAFLSHVRDGVVPTTDKYVRNLIVLGARVLLRTYVVRTYTESLRMPLRLRSLEKMPGHACALGDVRTNARTHVSHTSPRAYEPSCRSQART